jgi:hypothetical protein
LCGPTTRTWNISTPNSASIPGRLGGTTRFNFSLSYRLRCHAAIAPRLLPRELETILPTSCLATALSWGIGKQVREAQRSQPNPGGGSDNRMFVHDAMLACHPGSRRTQAFVRQRFRWPTTVPDVSHSSPLARSVHRTRLLSKLRLVSYKLCLSLTVLGLTSPRTLSWVSHRLMATPPS